MEREKVEAWAQGLIAGLIGYAVVVVFFALVNLIAGRSPFHTAAALGSLLFYGLEEPGRLVVAPGPVLAYNGVHLAASLFVGMLASWLVFETERHHFLWYFLFFVFLGVLIYSLLGVGIVAAELSGLLAWWSVVVADVAWVVSMGGYLYYVHRDLFREIEIEQESGA